MGIGAKVVSIRLSAMLGGLLLSIALVRTSDAMVRIADDMGGPLGGYLLKFSEIRDSGERVMIE